MDHSGLPDSDVELVRAAFDALNRRDLAFVSQFWTEGTVERFPDRTCRGKAEIVAYFEGIFAGLPDWQIQVRAIVGRGEDVFVHWHMTGTHAGPLLGIAPTGKRVALDGIDHFVIRDRKVVSNDILFDQMGFARQLGLLPPDGSRVDRALKAMFGVRTRLSRALRGRGARA